MPKGSEIGHEGNLWYLKRVLRHVIVKFHDQILMGRYIMKHELYCYMSWWYRSSKEDTRETFSMIAHAYPGVKWTNRGLFVPKDYLASEKGMFPMPKQPQ